MADGNTDQGGNRAGAPAGSSTTPFAARREILGDDALLTVKEVALLVGVSVRQIYFMIHRRTFPFPRKLGALSRWRLGTIKEWIRNAAPRC